MPATQEQRSALAHDLKRLEGCGRRRNKLPRGRWENLPRGVPKQATEAGRKTGGRQRYTTCEQQRDERRRLYSWGSWC
eukprot:3236092-Rhodomonas_salina.1